MSQVIINDIPPYTQASASGGQTVFGTTWTADAASDVYVYVTPAGDDPNDDTQILAYPADFSVSFVGALEQVQVTLVTPAALGDIVTITRQTPADRENLYSNTNFTPSMLNSDFGILTLVDQQAQLVNQLVGPRYNYSAIIEPIVDTILPILGANQGWTKNSADTAIIPIDFPSSGFAPAGGSYVTTTDESALLPDSFNLAAIGSGLLVNRTSDNTLLTTTMTGTADQITITNGTGLTGIINAAIATNPIMPGTAGMGIPQGTSAQRIVPVSGIGLRFNTDIQMVEYWNGSAWVTITDDTTLLALLASHAVNEGASLIGLQNQSNVSNKTVQDLANEVFLTGAAFSSLQNAQVLTAGSNIMLTPGAGTLTISASPGGGVNPGLINELAYYAAAGNTLSGLTTANNSVLVTSVTGVPSLSTVLPGGLTTTDPTLAQGIATKNYVDQTALNGTNVYAASAASLGTVTQAGSGVGATLTNAGVQAVFALDGVNPPVGSNVLIKNTATGMTAANEGIYTVTSVGSGATNWVLTRATSYDTVTEINHTGLIVIQNGSTLAGTAWYNTSTIVTVDTTNFSYSQFGNIIIPDALYASSYLLMGG